MREKEVVVQRPVGELKETAAEVQMGEKCGSGDSRQENLELQIDLRKKVSLFLRVGQRK